MNQHGIVRNLDSLGRIVIPKEFRKLKGITEDAPVEIFCEGDYVKIKKYDPESLKCSICESEKNINEFKGMYICNTCIKELKENYGDENE